MKEVTLNTVTLIRLKRNVGVANTAELAICTMDCEDWASQDIQLGRGGPSSQAVELCSIVL